MVLKYILATSCSSRYFPLTLRSTQ
uniref:Uncharacterized protein n=1 Tax=Anguilla anguilla TaxID=7936 RepID=A0A0E9UW94_ANGAN